MQSLIKEVETGNVGVVRQLLTTFKPDGGEGFRLLQACNRKKMFELLVKMGVDINSKNYNDGILHDGRMGVEKLKFLVGLGADVNMRDEGGQTPLYYFMTDPEAIAFLLECGANVNVLDQDDQSPLDVAVGVGENYSNVVAIQRGFQDEEYRRQGCIDNTYIGLTKHLVCDHEVKRILNRRSLEIVRLLIGTKIDVSKMSRAVTDAARIGHLEMVKILLDAGAYVDHGDGDRTALYWAAGNGDVDMAKLLLASGADPNIRMFDGKTAVRNAVDHGRLEMARVLVTAGAKDDLDVGECLLREMAENEPCEYCLCHTFADGRERVA